jgi:nucleoside-diphosphate-sugar epimerase
LQPWLRIFKPRTQVQNSGTNEKAAITSNATYLVLGATGQTGAHFVRHCLAQGNRVRVLARDPGKIDIEDANLEIVQGSVSNVENLDHLLAGVTAVVAMLGDAAAQKSQNINADFVERLVPAMRRTGVKRFLYQAGAFSTPPDRPLSPVLWLIKHTIAFRALLG